MIIDSKITIPIFRQQLLQRPHLVARLRESAAGKLTLVSAPGGFGKTSLVSQWIEEDQLAAAWYSIDASDVEQGVFFQYMLASLVAAAEDLREAFDPLMQAGAELSGLEIAGKIIVAMQGQREPLMLVLDDYHLVDAEEVHEAIALLLRHLPPSLHLTIVSRQEPPLALARLRAMGEVGELHAHSLRFTQEESSEILGRLAREPVDSWREQEIYERTEGWPIGVQMAGLSLQRPADRADHDSRFRVHDAVTLDYLLEEMLDNQPPLVRDFLLATSVLPRFSADLCNSMLGIDNAEDIIRLLEKNGAFILSLDEHSQWYRYHHLFTELLRDRLGRSSHTPTELHKQASRWYADHDLLDDAFFHAFASTDMDFAVTTLEKRWLELLGSYALSAARRWLDRVPGPLFQQSILLRLYRLCIMLSQEEMGGFKPQFDALEATLSAPSRSHSPEAVAYVNATMAPLKATYLYLNDRIDEAVQEAEPALAALPHNFPFARCVATVIMAYCYAEREDPLRALPMAEEAILLSEQVGHAHLYLMMVALRSGLQMSRGRLGEAQQLLSNSFDELLRGEFVKPSAVVHISAQMAAIFYRRNQLQEALEEAEKCIRYAEPQQANQSLLDAYTIKALALQAQGKPRQASAMIEEAQIIAAATAAPLRERGVDFAAINLALLQGDREFLVDWATAQHIDSSQPYSPTWEQTVLLLGRFLLRQGEFQRARDLIALLKPRAEKRIRFEACLVADLIDSAALKGLGQEDQARATLEGAIERAATEGYVQAFVEDAHCLHELLLSLRKSKNGPVRLYLPTLLKACHAVIEPSTSRRRVELEHGQELTPRETEILQLIAAGMSNKEIAAAAFVSLSTVKTHINHIFQKLEVGNRQQMISSARALEII